MATDDDDDALCKRGDHHSLDPVSGVLRESESSMLSVAQVFAQLAAGPFLHTAVPLPSTSWHS